MQSVPTVVRAEFEWDSDKAESNMSKHGISFQEGATVFEDGRALDLGDPAHPDRLLTIGLSARGRLLSVVSTERTDRIRVVSAREATPAERRQYESER